LPARKHRIDAFRETNLENHARYGRHAKHAEIRLDVNDDRAFEADAIAKCSRSIRVDEAAGEFRLLDCIAELSINHQREISGVKLILVYFTWYVEAGAPKVRYGDAAARRDCRVI